METIMVVDDESLVLSMVTRSLEQQGYSVLAARSGERGVACFEEHYDQIKLVLTDIVMPSMSGPEMVDRILRQKASVKVLFMTGYGAQATLPNLSETQFSVIQKPFTTALLARKVRDCLDESG